MICDSVSHLTKVQTSTGKVPHTYKELIKGTAIKVTTKQSDIKCSNPWGEKRKTRQLYHICQGDFEIKLLILQLVFQCDVSAVKNTSLVGCKHDNRR